MSFAKNSAWVEGAAPGISAARLQHIEDQAALFCVPSGGIIMWHGTIANIPTGWYICDGNNGTPNLLARFVQGVATAATDPGTTGGNNSHAHDQNMGASGTNAGGGQVVASSSLGSAMAVAGGGAAASYVNTGTQYTDGRPLYYDVAFIMKS